MYASVDHDRLDELARKMNENYEQVELLNALGKNRLPDRDRIVEIIKAIRRLMFPGYFGQTAFEKSSSHYFAGEMLSSIIEELKRQIVIALRYDSGDGEDTEEIKKRAEEISYEFAEKLPDIQRVLLTDVQAGVDGDPASSSEEEIIFSYPGFNAIFIYRIAHELYLLKVPFIPRVMTEYGHSRTGVDINPGATIGEYFFIDHGTGVVIGETCELSPHVKDVFLRVSSVTRRSAITLPFIPMPPFWAVTLSSAPTRPSEATHLLLSPCPRIREYPLRIWS